jgi:hypothetical protein
MAHLLQTRCSLCLQSRPLWVQLAVIPTGRLFGRPSLCGAHLSLMWCRVARRWYGSGSGGSSKKLDLDDRFCDFKRNEYPPRPL